MADENEALIEFKALVHRGARDVSSGPSEPFTPTSSDVTSPKSSIAASSPGDGDGIKKEPGTLVLHAPSKFRGQHPPGVWEALKPVIHKLYIDDELPLKEVREIMIQKGFVATEKMYKDKFAKWGYTKNNRRKDVARMVQMEKQRKVIGKKTMFRRNGKVVDIDSYMKRAKLSPDQLEKMTATEELPVLVRFGTPPPSHSALAQLREPGYHHLQQLLLRTFDDLSARTKSVLGNATAASAFSNYPRTEFYQTVRHLRDASWLFEQGCNHEAGILMRRGFADLHMVVKEPNEWALCDLLMYQMSLVKFGHHDLIWKYLSDYAAIAGGPLPWLCDVFRALLDFFQDYPTETCLDFIAELLGLIYPNMVLADITPQRARSFLMGSVSSISRMHYANSSVKRFAKSMDTPSSSLLETVLDADEPLFRYYELFALGERSDWQDPRILEIITGLQAAESSPDSQRLCLRALAYFHMGQWKLEPTEENPRHNLARQYLQQALDLVPFVTFGGLSVGAQREVWEDMKLLESWYREAGDPAAAQDSKQKRKQALATFMRTVQPAPDSPYT